MREISQYLTMTVPKPSEESSTGTLQEQQHSKVNP